MYKRVDLWKGPITLRILRNRYPDLFAPSDWWFDEDFAHTELPEQRSPLNPTVLEEWRGKVPPASLALPTAALAAVTFIGHWRSTGKVLWPYEYIWCSDRDNAGDQIYVGGYTLGRHQGFEVHRHLTLRRHHTVALVEAA